MHAVAHAGIAASDNGQKLQVESTVKIAGLISQTINERDGPTDNSSPICSKMAQTSTAASSSPPKVAYSHYPVSVTIKRKQMQMKAAAII